MPINSLLLSIAGFLTGLSQLVNKKLAIKGHKSTTYATVFMLLNALLALPLLFYKFYISRSIYYWLLIFISAATFALSTYFGFKAYKRADISIVSIVYRLNIVMVAFIGILFLKEDYSLQAYAGLLLIFLSGLTLVFEGKKLKLSLGVLYALLMALTGSAAVVLDKIILNDFSPYTYVFINNLLVGLVFAFNKKTLYDAKKLIKQNPVLLLLASFFSTLSFVIILVVLQKTNVSQTIPAYKSLSLIVPVILGILLLDEKKQISQKVIGTALGILGILLLY